MRFKGWKHSSNSSSVYQKWFSQPRARAARGQLLVATGKTALNATPHFSGATLPGILLRDSLPAGYIPTAAATGDFNGDGKMDFAVANGGDNNLWLYFGKGDGTFSLPVILPITMGQSPVWLTSVDLRGIGREDLVVAEADSNSIGVFLSNGDGTFTETSYALPGTAITLTIADFNHDGKLDIVAPMDDENPSAYVVMLPGIGNGTFGAPSVTPLSGVAPSIVWVSSGDVNGDGFPDLLLSNPAIQPQAVQVYLNDGKGGFIPGQVVAEDFDSDDNGPTALFDVDGDGVLDALVTNTLGMLQIFHGNGDGTFATSPTDFAIGDFPADISIADVNGDGHPDVLISGLFVDAGDLFGTEAGDQICVLLGDGKGNFEPPMVYRGDSTPVSLAIADFNGDGHPDVVTANQDSDTASIFLNDGQGEFGKPQGKWVGYPDGGPVNAPVSNPLITDVDGDGSQDVVFLEFSDLNSNNYQITTLLNDGQGNFSDPVRSDGFPTSFQGAGDFVLADFRNTGHPDFLAIATDFASNPFISFAPNVGSGRFGAFTVTNPANAYGVIGVGDFNHDGNLDFVAGFQGGNSNSIELQVFSGNGAGSFQPSFQDSFANNSGLFPVAIYTGDFNRDGNLDLLVVANNPGGFDPFIVSGDDMTVYELLGNGDGTFQSATLLFANCGPVAVADVNNDGNPDVIVLTPAVSILLQTPVSASFSVYLGQPDGSFALSYTFSYGQQVFLPLALPTVHDEPVIADFNGDGNLDIAAFQYFGDADLRHSYVQFLLGNGDGTFTPTYDVFDFRKSIFTAYPGNLIGTGHAGLFELNGFLSTYNILPETTAPPFQLSLVDDPVVGTTGEGIILLDVPSASSSTLNIASSDPAISVPTTITIPAGQVSQTFNFAVGPGFNPNHVFSISAQLGSASAIAYGTVVASGSAGFTATMSLGTSSLTNIDLAAGQTQNNILVTLSSTNGYNTTVALQCLGLPAQAQCNFTLPNLAIVPGNFASSGMSVSVEPDLAQGSYPAQLQVSDGILTKTIPFTLNIGDFSLSLSPSVLTMFPTENFSSYNLTYGIINNFAQDVNLSCSGLPVGTTCALAYSGVNAEFVSPDTVFITTQNVPAGSYQVTVTGTSPPLTHTATATLQIWDFNASVSPASSTISAGGSANFTVSVTPVNGFNQSVSLQCQIPAGFVSCTFNPVSPTISAGGITTDTLTITVSPQFFSHSINDLRRTTRTWFLGLTILPFGILLLGANKSRKQFVGLLLVLMLVCWVPSCGGGPANTVSGGGGVSGGTGGTGGTGGGGGGGTSTPQSFPIDIVVSAGTHNVDAGTIMLTVN